MENSHEDFSHSDESSHSVHKGTDLVNNGEDSIQCHWFHSTSICVNHVPDADGLNDRQLFDFPPEREMLLDELVVLMPADTPDLLQTFLVV